MPSPDFSLHGAIDLGARQAAAKKQQERQRAGGGSQYVVDVTDDTFNGDVVQRSRTVPVIVDFWAEWCGPCKQLSPILEKLAAEGAGRWVLAKVDIDANPQLAAYMQQLGVRGIPFVAVVVAGQLMPFLQGAAPEADVRRAIDQLFVALEEQGLLPDAPPPQEGDEEAEEAGAPARDPALAQAEEAMRRGDVETAATAFQQILDADPLNPEAKRGLALVDLGRRVQSYDPAQVEKDAAERPGDAQAQLRQADVELVTGRIEEAFERLVQTIRRTAGDDREDVRVHLLQLFELLPPDDPRVVKGRRALSSALF
ncbi:MAG TPA: tetratricopeptide repeat protein [Streptosporangiaceae bacterium]|nr:tetratricopeptide repeat protein [Streptosporangiaceae bacterium]